MFLEASINAVSRKGEWRKLVMTVDRATVNNIGGPDFEPDIEIEETPVSKRGLTYGTANEGTIRNIGQKKIQGQTRETRWG